MTTTVAAPEPLADHLLGILRDGDPWESGQRAVAMIAAAAAFLQEQFGEDRALEQLAGIAQAVKYRGILERCQPSPAGLH